MPRRERIFQVDRRETLLSTRAEVEEQVSRLRREEEFLGEQVRRAQEQVRYYEGLLAELRTDWGKRPPLEELVRKLG